ncbi:MAG: hypothetical protein Q8888_02100 [Vigna little leaf phytoplasma]|nr:hypothetical protein [Vigna little leaf phytoplasma]
MSLIILIEKKIALNHLRLHKIIYYAQIKSLLVRKRPLMKARLEALVIWF